MPIEPGVSAPLFEAQDHQGQTIRLKDYLGKTVVLFFYPKSDTPTCTVEACNLRDHHDELLAKGYVVIGISPDKLSAQEKFSKKYDLPYALIGDSDQIIHQLYDTWVEKSMYGRKYMGTERTTFVIDPQGMIAHTITKVDAKNHTEQILALS